MEYATQSQMEEIRSKNKIWKKENEIVDLFKKYHGDENDQFNLWDISIKDFNSFTEENQRICFFLFEQLMDLLAEDQRQIIDENFIFYLRKNLMEDKLKTLPSEQQARYKLNERKIKDLDDIRLELCENDHHDSYKMTDKFLKWDKEYSENKFTTSSGSFQIIPQKNE